MRVLEENGTDARRWKGLCGESRSAVALAATSAVICREQDVDAALAMSSSDYT